MLEFRKKKTMRRVLYSPWTLGVLLIITIFLGHAAWSVAGKERMSRASLDRSVREFEKLTVREQDLAHAVEYLATPQGVETEIRQKFRVAKEGESVAIILDDAPSTSTSTVTAPSGFIRASWSWLLHFFGGK